MLCCFCVVLLLCCSCCIGVVGLIVVLFCCCVDVVLLFSVIETMGPVQSGHLLKVFTIYICWVVSLSHDVLILDLLICVW